MSQNIPRARAHTLSPTVRAYLVLILLAACAAAGMAADAFISWLGAP